MEHKITFYPIGNADTTLIELNNNQKILFDYANMRNGEENDKRIDLSSELNKVVVGDYDVVCFTHLDNDHICGSSDYFHFEHATIYQGNGRKKIKELWVPANVLVETVLDGDERVIRAEARYRLKKKSGIRIFSRPKKLKDWCDSQEDICYDDICHLIVDAGTLTPGFAKNGNGVEFFVHSPFVSETQHIDRNNEAIVVQATFNDACETKMMLGSDINHDAWADIVKITRHFGRDIRLAWDFFHISHHCSYTALNSEKGNVETTPNLEVKWLFETMGNKRSRIISPSWTIPSENTLQPPHRQTAAYYRKVANMKEGEFKVTMDHPSISNPKPMTYIIDSASCARLYIKPAAASFAFDHKPPRAGNAK
jgi:beta-lactamase superfamily II metal-dependent hydrolase